MADLDLSGDQSAQDHDAHAGATNPVVDYSSQQPAGSPPEISAVPYSIDYSIKEPAGPPPPPQDTKKITAEESRENTRGDLARGLLWLLTFAIGGVLVFIGLGRLDGTVLTQSIFPSLVALAGTALGFYFGSQTAKESGPSAGVGANGAGTSTGSVPTSNTGGTGQQKIGN